MFDEMLSQFIILWAVVDPIGTIPIFIAVTKGFSEEEKVSIARFSSLVAFGILVFFMIAGEFLLRKIGVPLSAFQISGGLVLLLLALNMIFGDSKPEEEMSLVKNGQETAIFPLAIPSIAGPGAILAVVLLTDSSRHSMVGQSITVCALMTVLILNFALMRLSGRIDRKIGKSGAIVISKVMGLVLASMAATNILVGIKDFFKIGA